LGKALSIVTIKADGADVKIDDVDEPSVGKFTWHLHNGKPRAKVYLLPTPSPNHDVRGLTADPHQIALERFVYKITPYTNIRIRHLFGDEFNCARSTMFLEKKNSKLSSKYFGVVLRGQYFFADVADGPNIITLGPFVSEYDAAKAHDIKAIELMGWRAKTNFYPQL
jgi:hypothetical protein